MNMDEFLAKMRAAIASPDFTATDSEVVVDDGCFVYHILDVKPQGNRIVLFTELDTHAPSETHRR